MEEELIGFILLDPTLFFLVKDQVQDDDITHPVTNAVWKALDITMTRGTFSLSLVEDNAKDVPREYILATYLPTLLSNAADAKEQGLSVYDLADTVAERGQRRRLRQALSDALTRVSADDKSTVEEMGAEVINAISAASRNDKRGGTNFIALLHRVAEQALNPDPAAIPASVETGLPEINRLTGPWRRGECIVLAGNSGSGKTSLAMQIAWHAAQDAPVLVCEAEMAEHVLAERQLALLTGVAINRITSGDLNSAEREAITTAKADLDNRMMEIHARKDLTTNAIRAAALRWKSLCGDLGLVMIDHVKLIRPSEKTKSDLEQIAHVMRFAKSLAKDLDCCVLVLGQMTREGQKRLPTNGKNITIQDVRPQRFDVFGGGAIEENADAVLLLHQPSLALRRLSLPGEEAQAHVDFLAQKYEGKGELIADKVRNGVAGRHAMLEWDGPRFCYSTVTD